MAQGLNVKIQEKSERIKPDLLDKMGKPGGSDKVDKTLERLREEAARSGNMTKVVQYRAQNREEEQFQKWIKGTGWYKEFVKEYGEEPDLNIKEYDYRAAWKAGIQPERDPYDNNRFHWASTDPKTGNPLKSAEHPTAWKEDYMQRTGKNPDAAGVTKEQYEKMLGTKALIRKPNPGAERMK